MGSASTALCELIDTIRCRGGERAAIECAARMELGQRATWLGGVESLVEHRASMEGPDSPRPRDLLRLSVGLEDVDDLIADIEKAFRLLWRNSSG